MLCNTAPALKTRSLNIGSRIIDALLLPFMVTLVRGVFPGEHAE